MGVECLLKLSRHSARTKEAALYVLKQILDELDSCSAEVNPNFARAYLEYIGLAMRDGESNQQDDSQVVFLLTPCGVGATHYSW